MSDSTDLRTLAGKYDAGNLSGYLTYPLVVHWRDAIDEAEVTELCRRAVADQRAAGAYLYFHFPYCEVRCTYCACYMQVTTTPEAKYDAYLDAMETEFALKLDSGAGTIRVSDMHWGGGTPTLMTTRQMERIFRRISDRVEWTGTGELSIEAYPDRQLMTDDKLQLIKDLGFTRVSFGLECTDPKVLKAINRKQNPADIAYLFEKARKIGLGVHTDVVYGLPHQTLETLERTLTTITELSPDRLDTFSFMYAPSVVPHQAAIPQSSLPGSFERVELYQLLDRFMLKAGYKRVGIDHYTLYDDDPLTRAQVDGTLTYSANGYEPEARGSMLGFGSASMSFTGDTYFQNTRNIDEYVARLAERKLPLNERNACRLTDDDRIRHRVIMKHLFCWLGVDKAALAREQGVDFDTYFATTLPALRAMEQDGLLSGVDSPFIRITDLGRPYFRRICALFDGFYSAIARLRVIS